jgi:hypothetical protein
VLAAIHVLCDADPSRVTAVINGLIAWATTLGGVTAVGSGLPAAALAFDRDTKPGTRADQINRGLGVGFIGGMIGGLMMFIVFSARLVS